MKVKNLKTYNLEIKQISEQKDDGTVPFFTLTWNGWSFTGTKKEILEQLEIIIDDLEES